MRLLKSYSFLKLGNSYLIDAPQPSNLSYAWNFGSLLAVCLIIQIVSGVTLAMHYNPSVMEAFNSVEHIMRDVNNGWFIRYLHSNTASAFFFLVYLHIGRGLYYGSYKAPRTLTWAIGTIILVLMMAIGFLGYVYSPIWFNLFFFLNFFLVYKNNSFHKKSVFKTQNLLPLHNKHLTKNISIFSKRYYSTNKKDNLSISLVVKENMNTLNLNPVFIYENIHLKLVQTDIKNELKNLSGIYMIFNKITGQYYIGSASTNKFYSRFYKHFITGSHNKHLKNAIKKYGIDNFAFIILELFPEVTDQVSNKGLLDLEQTYIDLLPLSYNIALEAGNTYGYKHEDWVRANMKAYFTPERRKAIGDLNRGKKLSPEVIEKIREAALKRPPMSPETKLKCITKNKPVILYNKNGTVFGQFTSILEAAKAVNCNEKTISRALKTDSKLVKKMWKIELI